ncbi:MAG TPA: nucleoside deaminase [Candidatus Cottocaccamicrobium excrementipullorum]|nr:nucleoside deaminase [Candidatus Cottocaccamicrobium excrementipullorum]
MEKIRTPLLTEDEKYMKEAIRQARKAESLGEVPIGCVIVYQGKIIGRGYNRRMIDHTVLAHGEIIAMKKACRKMGDWRLEGCRIYITLEPCPMCAGAIVQARIPEVVIGSMNPKAGCAGSVLDLLHQEGFNHRCQVKTGVLQEECSAMMTGFFRQLREAGKQKKKEERRKKEEAAKLLDRE